MEGGWLISILLALAGAVGYLVATKVSGRQTAKVLQQDHEELAKKKAYRSLKYEARRQKVNARLNSLEDDDPTWDDVAKLKNLIDGL